MTPILDRTYSGQKTRITSSLRWIYRIEPLVGMAIVVAVSPLLVVTAIVITLLSRRTPLIRHRRVGWHGSDLPMLKFRTMWEPHQPWGSVFAIEDISSAILEDKSAEDSRVSSRFAAWCRKYSIDELPQFLHVARGEMSFVGPRPITSGELEEHYGSDRFMILSLRPGLTGLWQMLGRNRLSYSQRKRLDLWMVRCASPGLYLTILIRSIPRILVGRDAY